MIDFHSFAARGLPAMGISVLFASASLAWSQGFNGAGGQAGGGASMAVPRVDVTGTGAGGGMGNGGAQGGGGLRAVTRPTVMQNTQVLARNFFAAGGVPIQPRPFVADRPNGAGAQGSTFVQAGQGTTQTGVRVAVGQSVQASPGEFQKPALISKNAEQPTASANATAALARRARAGSAQAQYELGLRYAAGAGVPRNKEFARRWFQLAARNGHPEAARTWAAVSQQGRGE